MSDRAVIEAELQGAGKVVADAKKIAGALGDAKKEGEGVANNTRGAASELRTLGQQLDAMRSALDPRALLGGVVGGGVVQMLSQLGGYLSAGADKAQVFNESTALSARRAGLSVESYRAALQSTAEQTGQTVEAQQALVDQVQSVTYRGKEVQDSLDGIAKTATVLGVNIRQLAGPIVALQEALGPGANIGTELERLVAEARRVGSQGGPQALLDTITAMRPALQGVSQDGDMAARKLMAFAAVLQRTRTPEQARSLAANLEGTLRSRMMDVEAYMGRKVTRNGRFDPVDLLKELKARALKLNHNNPTAARTGMQRALGVDLGEAAFDVDLGEVERQAAISDRAPIDKEFGAIRTPEQKRAVRGQKQESRLRRIGRRVLEVYDAAGEVADSAFKAYDRASALSDEEILAPLRGPEPTAAPTAPGSSVANPGGALRIEFPKGFAEEVGAAAGRGAVNAIRGKLEVKPGPADPNGKPGGGL